MKNTLRNKELTNADFRLIGAQQKIYRALRGNPICSIIFAKNLKSSIPHMKYKESSTVDNVTKISYKKEQNLDKCWYYNF